MKFQPTERETSLRRSGIRARVLDELGQPLSDAEEAKHLVRELLAGGPADRAEPTLRLCMLGMSGLDAAAAAFPGPLWCARGRESDPESIAPLVHVITQFGSIAIPHVSRWLRDEDVDRRYCAILVTAAMAPEALLTLVDPLVDVLIGSEDACRMAATGALLLPNGPAWAASRPNAETAARIRPLMTQRLRAIAADTSRRREERILATVTLSELRDEGSLLLLVELLGGPDRSVGRAAHLALRRLTAHDFGTLTGAWRSWANANGHRRREQWLIEALADRRPELRLIALADLNAGCATEFAAASADPDDFLDLQQTFLRWQRHRSRT